MRSSAKGKGFTLVELMVVVAIIGLLAALAIPNFIRFQARSKQSEAKTSLKAIFQGEKSYYAEYDRYTTLAGDVAFAPERGNRYNYDLGTTSLTPQTAATWGCPVIQLRQAATVTFSGGGAGECGIQSDVFRYSTASIPSVFTGRSPATYQQSIIGNGAMAADSVGVNIPSCPNCDFGARAWGNVDNDLGADEFFVSSQFISIAAALCAERDPAIQPGAPAQTRNDVSCE